MNREVRREIEISHAPRGVNTSLTNEHVQYHGSRTDRDELYTTQILTTTQVRYFQINLSLLEVVQDEVDRRMLRNQPQVVLVEGNYLTDNFIGKMLCHKRYKAHGKFHCQRQNCQNKWTSENTTIEMLLQNKPSIGNQALTCNVIIRSYLQLCKDCGGIGSVEMKPRSVESFVNKMVADVYDYYDIRALRVPQIYRRQ